MQETQETGSILGWRKWQPASVVLPGESYEQNSLDGYLHFPYCLQEDVPLEKWEVSAFAVSLFGLVLITSSVHIPFNFHPPLFISGFPGGADSKESACNAGDLGSIPGLRRSPGEGNGNPFQYSCLENSMDSNLVCYSPRGGKESDLTEQLTLPLFISCWYLRKPNHSPLYLSSIIHLIQPHILQVAKSFWCQ